MRGLKKYKAEIRQVIWLFLAAFIVLMLHCNVQVIEGIESTSILVQFMSKLSNSFTYYHLTDIFVWIAIYTMIRYVVLHDNTAIDVWCVIFSALFSFTYILSKSYLYLDSMEFFTKNGYQLFLSGLCFIGYLILFYLCLRALLISIDEHADFFIQRSRFLGDSNHILLVSFFIIFICWLPWIILNYPGSICLDSQYQLQQIFGYSPYTTHHPPLSTYIMRSLISIAHFLGGDNNFGVFLYVFFQTCFGAWVFSLGVKKLYIRGRVRFRYCIVGVFFYALTPFWGSFAQWYEKDLLYAEAATLFLIFLIDIVIKRECSKKDIFIITLTGLLTSLLRNEGIYLVLPAIFLLVIFMKKQIRKAIWISFFMIILLYSGIVKVLYPSVLGIKEGSTREMLSIPFQQTARYVAEYSDEVTEYEKKIINSVLDYDSLAKIYHPASSDPVKSKYKEDDSKLKEYYKVWAQMFLKHPNVYISAFINGAYGYISPVIAMIEPEIKIDYGDEFSYLESIGVHRGISKSFGNFFASVKAFAVTTPLIQYLSMPGMYTWILLTCIMIVLKKRLFEVLPIFVPGIMNILVCIASPLADSMRYELPVIAFTPLLIGWTYCFAYSHDIIIDNERV